MDRTSLKAHKKRKLPSTKLALALPKRAKVSNRPRYSPSPSSSNHSDSDSDTDDDDEAERAAMLAALEKHQAEFLEGAGVASRLVKGKGKGKGKEVEVPVVKSVWEMGMDDFDDEDEDNESDEDEEDSTLTAQSRPTSTTASSSAVAVVAFEEPRLSVVGGASGGGDMRSFMSSKVKNARKVFSVADAANAKVGRKPKKIDVDDVDAEQESHLSSLDAHLSSLIRPLTSATGTTQSQFPSLLAALPTAPTKKLKGSTPLPGNAPRTLRRGQAAKNLERAKSRDEAAGILEGQNGREAKSLKEKRKEEGEERRERGIGGAIGKAMKGGLKLSKEDIRRGSGDFSRGGPKSGRGGKGGRGGGGGGGSRGKKRH